MTGAATSGPRRLARRVGRHASRIAARLMLFNLLLVFLPVAGILYLDVYETRLLVAQERSMGRQARLVAAAMSRSAALEADARALLERLEAGEPRLRVFNTAGEVIADTARRATDGRSAAAGSSAGPDVRTSWLYRVGARLAAWRRGLTDTLLPSRTVSRSPYDDPQVPTDVVPPEVRAALAGGYGAATRQTPGQRSLTLSIALPVTVDGRTSGAVQVSQSTFRILQALYDVRLRIFRVVVASLGVAVVISALVALTIVRPLRRLRDTAIALSEHGDRDRVTFPGTGRTDEVGDLARALEALTLRLQAQVALLDAFTADVAHEFRNPLAAIRSAADVLDDAESDEERRHFVARIKRDVERLDRLVLGARAIARAGAPRLAGALPRTDLEAVVRQVVQARFGTMGIDVQAAEPLADVLGEPERLEQLVENLLDNATSFSPAPASVSVTLAMERGMVRMSVVDHGPGIQTEHLDRVFERFFSYRPEGGMARDEHVGLGLAIARAIVSESGGTISASQRAGGGTVMDVRLPAAA